MLGSGQTPCHWGLLSCTKSEEYTGKLWTLMYLLPPLSERPILKGGSVDFLQWRNMAEISSMHWNPISCSSYKQNCWHVDAHPRWLLGVHVENVSQTLSPHHVQLPLGHSCHLICFGGDPQPWHNGGSLSYIFQSTVIIARFLLSREIWPIEFSLKIIFFSEKENRITLFFSTTTTKKIDFIWGGRRGASFEVDCSFQNITGSLGPASDYIIDIDLPQINTEPFKKQRSTGIKCIFALRRRFSERLHYQKPVPPSVAGQHRDLQSGKCVSSWSSGGNVKLVWNQL